MSEPTGPATEPPTGPATGPATGMAATLGLRPGRADPDEAVVTLTVESRHLQPFGLLHGGVHCALVEAAAAAAAGAWYADRGTVRTLHVATDFVRPVRAGAGLTATATPLHRGRGQQLWSVVVTEGEDRLVARGEARLRNLPPS